MSIDEQGEAAAPNRVRTQKALARKYSAKHLAVAHAIVRGLSNRDAGLEAGYTDGPGLDGNIARLKQQPHMRELILEIAAQAAEGANIYDAWILSNIRLFAKASLAQFWKRDEAGRLIVNKQGEPMLDLTRATEDQLRCLSELSHGKYGPKIKIHKPLEALALLARCRGLYNEENVAVTVNNTVANQLNVNDARQRIAGKIEQLAGRATGESPAT